MTWRGRDGQKDFGPSFAELPYYAGLARGAFSLEQTLLAHTQDLARSIGCRGLREHQLAVLESAVDAGQVAVGPAQELRSTIHDELPAPGRKSHFDVRAQMFLEVGLTLPELECVKPLPSTQAATALFRLIFEHGSLLEMTAAVGSIEQWYVPVAARLESLYLSLGYSAKQVETYTLHKVADGAHSDVALRFVEEHATDRDAGGIERAVRVGFESVRRYDTGRLEAALSPTQDLRSWFGVE